MVRFHLRRFEAWAISFTPLCPCLSEETLKAVGPNSCVSSRLGCLEYNYLRLETTRKILILCLCSFNRHLQVYIRLVRARSPRTARTRACTHACTQHLDLGNKSETRVVVICFFKTWFVFADDVNQARHKGVFAVNQNALWRAHYSTFAL